MNNVILKFIKDTEKKITPDGIAMTFNNAQKLMKLPRFLQNLIIKQNTKTNQYMGFVVEPYSLFLAYEITEELVKDFLPDTYELIPISIFDQSDKKLCGIIGCFNVHTSVFWGSRFELYVIAKNKKTNLISWLICDYESNTFHYDPGKGFLPSTLQKSVFTTAYDGNIICDIESKKKHTKIDLMVDVNQHNCVGLNQRLWIEGNLSIDYTGALDNNGIDPFGLIFDPMEMKCAQHIETNKIAINHLEFGFITADMKPYEVCCFPFAQHYITTVFPEGHMMKNEKDLYARISELVNK
ncbi:hypothetical protein [Acetobacterium woodii]|uniref:Acetoacetate decarboxylase n=1 Tax=Acetobacterium woodii (strain ATCC 29683 / DSM 1030 / JCM 2381 / KCTC 1655 / WB1) TaxID=931626 RepID=H6LBU2_ACEWD|nr:hypothetical protein [Acetobacterium woodii]AFA47685.1 hypothetical protein Awo_c08940 [Acetobacterium woodii DSM 1030]